jgi:hypothetical protein
MPHDQEPLLIISYHHSARQGEASSRALTHGGQLYPRMPSVHTRIRDDREPYRPPGIGDWSGADDRSDAVSRVREGRPGSALTMVTSVTASHHGGAGKHRTTVDIW